MGCNQWRDLHPRRTFNHGQKSTIAGSGNGCEIGSGVTTSLSPYHWASGGVYAVNLAQMLRSNGFDVFLDRADYASGDDWKRMGQIALRNTQRFVLVATNEAVFGSKPFEHEVLEFSKRSRQIVPICFVYTLSPEAPCPDGFSEEVWTRIRGTTLGIPQPVVVPKGRRYERQSDASLPNAPATDQMLPDKPSKRVINELIRTHKVLRRRNLRALLTLIPVIIVSVFAVFATYQRRDARIAESNAVQSRSAESLANHGRGAAVMKANLEIVQERFLNGQKVNPFQACVKS